MSSKYTALHGDVYSIFGSEEWINEGIKTFPQNFVGSNLGSEYIRVSILASGLNIASMPRSTAGQVIIDIFVPAGDGLKRAAQIADKLDTYLAGKVIKTSTTGMTQFGVSSFSPRGDDVVDKNLYRASYSISFNFFGV